MKLAIKLGLAAGVAVLALAAPASAAPVTVNLRIEGRSATLFSGPVTTDTRSMLDGNDSSGTHPCDASATGTPVPTAGAALATAAERTPFALVATWDAGFGDFFVTTLAGETPPAGSFWAFWFNDVFSATGVCGTPVHDGDEILLADVAGLDPPLGLRGPATARQGDRVTVTVTDESTGAVVPGATVAPPGVTAGVETDSRGNATVTLADAGARTLQASKAGAIRSKPLSITVTAPHAPATGGSVADRAAPAARLLGIRDHQVFAKRKGPRTLRATAPDPSGLAVVKLRLTRRASGRCAYFSGRRAAFVRTRCGRAFSFKVGTEPSVSYLLPARLTTGRYVLDLTAADRAGNRTALARARTRVVFTVR